MLWVVAISLLAAMLQDIRQQTTCYPKKQTASREDFLDKKFTASNSITISRD
jgi:hypothetical protein